MRPSLHPQGEPARAPPPDVAALPNELLEERAFSSPRSGGCLAPTLGRPLKAGRRPHPGGPAGWVCQQLGAALSNRVHSPTPLHRLAGRCLWGHCPVSLQKVALGPCWAPLWKPRLIQQPRLRCLHLRTHCRHFAPVAPAAATTPLSRPWLMLMMVSLERPRVAANHHHSHPPNLKVYTN